MTRHVAALIRQAVNQLPESFIILDNSGDVAFLNQKAMEMDFAEKMNARAHLNLGCTAGEWASDIKSILCHLRTSNRSNLTTTAEDPKSGRVFCSTFSMLRDASGRHMGTVVMSKEIAALRYISFAAADCANHETMSHRLGALLVECLETLSDVLDSHEPYTLGHSLRVRDLAVAMAKERWGASADLEVVSLAGQLHDIGKVAVKPEILTKPGRLTDEEWSIVKTHPVVGELIMKPIARLGEIAKVIRHHHERFDGSGYPDHLVGNAIPALARILAIADSYDAMTSARPYREAIPSSEAIKEIQANAGTLYDPDWVRVFVTLMRRSKDS